MKNKIWENLGIFPSSQKNGIAGPLIIRHLCLIPIFPDFGPKKPPTPWEVNYYFSVRLNVGIRSPQLPKNDSKWYIN